MIDMIRKIFHFTLIKGCIELFFDLCVAYFFKKSAETIPFSPNSDQNVILSGLKVHNRSVIQWEGPKQMIRLDADVQTWKHH